MSPVKVEAANTQGMVQDDRGECTVATMRSVLGSEGTTVMRYSEKEPVSQIMFPFWSGGETQ
jgi:hypothetical protein